LNAREKNLKQVSEQSKKQKKPAQTFARTLRQEANELEALRGGLVRHLTAWRSAHDATVASIEAQMARTDAILERIERNRAPQG
jgi:hypothetical protein